MLAQNLETAGFAEVGHVHHARVERALRFLVGPYQLVLLDPPYQMPDLSGFMERLAATPGLLADGGIVVVGHSQRVTLLEKYGELRQYSHRRYGDNVLDFYCWGGGEW